MAIVTLHRGVSAKQGEAVLVLLQLLSCDVPPLNHVALRAVRAHFSLVDVGMTILTVFAHVGEDRFRVAQGALDSRVHAAKGILGFVMVKFRYRANRTPTCCGVTVFARDRKGSVRTSGRLPLSKRSRRVSWPQEKEPAQKLKEDWRSCLQRYRSLDTSPSL